MALREEVRALREGGGIIPRGRGTSSAGELRPELADSSCRPRSMYIRTLLKNRRMTQTNPTDAQSHSQHPRWIACRARRHHQQRLTPIRFHTPSHATTITTTTTTPLPLPANSNEDKSEAPSANVSLGLNAVAGFFSGGSSTASSRASRESGGSSSASASSADNGDRRDLRKAHVATAQDEDGEAHAGIQRAAAQSR